MQGRGLEITGHAIEYLIDSYVTRSGGDRADREAAQILMSLNIAIYQECPEIIPLTRKVSSAIKDSLQPFVFAYSAITAAWTRVLVSLALKKEKSSPTSEPDLVRAQRLITERYGPSFCRRDQKTGLYQVFTESGDILDSGDSEEEAWHHSAFHVSAPPEAPKTEKPKAEEAEKLVI